MQKKQHYQMKQSSLGESHEQNLKCPRCESYNTKFCYYNNYNLTQPRHFCKTCRRYWTKGGALRNVPVGGGCRKNSKRPNKTKPNEDPTLTYSPSNNNTHNPSAFPSTFPSVAISEGLESMNVVSGSTLSFLQNLWAAPMDSATNGRFSMAFAKLQNLSHSGVLGNSAPALSSLNSSMSSADQSGFRVPNFRVEPIELTVAPQHAPIGGYPVSSGEWQWKDQLQVLGSVQQQEYGSSSRLFLGHGKSVDLAPPQNQIPRSDNNSQWQTGAILGLGNSSISSSSSNNSNSNSIAEGTNYVHHYRYHQCN